MSLSQSERATVSVPVRFMTYLVGLIAGAAVGAAIVLTAAVSKGFAPLIVVTLLVAFLFAVGAWGSR